MSRATASIITIGDELLIGQVVDTNSAWIAQQLNKLGIDVTRRVAVGDEVDAIKSALDEERRRSSIVLLTGGLGPTADDITKPLLCEYFNGKMVVDEKVSAHLHALFERLKRPIIARNLKQAEVPDVCTVLFNAVGTAPGMWFEENGTIFVSMPGVPFEMIYLMEHEVIPRLKERFFSDAIVHRTIMTAGEGESFIAEKILDIENALPPHIRLAYLPQSRVVRLRLTGRAKDEAALIEEVEVQQQLIATRLQDIVVSLEDNPLEHALGKALQLSGQTLALAESCTGGYISHLITQVAGASEYFKGGVVSYLPDVKESALKIPHDLIAENGEVSEELAIAMAKGAKSELRADIGFGITGVLGPGEWKGLKSGTVWVAATDGNRTVSKQFSFPYDRIRNKEIAVQMSLLFLIKFQAGKL